MHRRGLFASATLLALATSPILAQDSPPAPAPPPPPAPTIPSDARDVELKELRTRLEAVEKKQAAGDKEKADAATAAAADDADDHPEVIPFSDGDTSWEPGGYAPSKSVLKWGPFTGEVRADAAYHYEPVHQKDDTISGSAEAFRSNEFQLTQLGVGGDFYYKGAMARFMTQFGMYSETQPRNDASPSRGQWNLDNAYRYLSEAYGGYHFNALAGVNVQAGIFMSYIGLWSFYNFDNWTYQPSYVSSNTPFFFNGMRVQIYPFKNLKIEPWLTNGWQSYGKFNQGLGVGMQVKWQPAEWLGMVANSYYGTDTLNTPGRRRLHSDNSFMVRYFNDPRTPEDDKADKLHAVFSRAAVSVTLDYGNEDGGGSNVRANSQYFMGFMAYNRVWFIDNHFGFTFGGGAIKNPGRYLVLLPPINGATAASGTPFFTENPGDDFYAWDMQATGDWSPTEWVTFRVEYNHRVASVPYFSGHGGVTPPGGNQGPAGSAVAGFTPDLVKTENRVTVALMVRY